MHHETVILVTIIAAVGFGLLAQVLAHRWHIPAIVLLLISGILLGPSVLHVIEPEALGDGLNILVKLAVAIILFDGALNLRLTTLRNAAFEIRNLVTIGVLITWGLVSLAAHYLTHLPWTLAILFGALMTVTGPTVVQPLLKRIHIPKNIKTILEGEAILIDPIGAILAVAVLDVILTGPSAGQDIGIFGALWAYFGRLVVGAVVGGVGAVVLSQLMKVPRLIPAEISNLVALAIVWASFGIAETLHSEAGIMASVAMGLLLQRESIPGERQLRHFKESLTTLSISVLFVLLAANLDLQSIIAEGMNGILLIATMMFIIRPISVFISTWNTKLKWQEKLFIAWVGPRGIVAASAASFFALTLTRSGNSEGGRILSLTFLAIMITVTLQGLTASLVSRLLRLHTLEGKKAIIVGATRFANKIAILLNENGRPAVLIDTNLSAIESAKKLGVETVHGNALEQSVLEQADIEGAETLLAITPNAEVNVLVAQLAREEFGVARAYPSLKNPDKGAGTELLSQTGGKLAFGRPIDVSQWDANFKKIKSFAWEVPQNWTLQPVSSMSFSENLLPVILKRRGNTQLTHADQVWQAGETIIFLTTLSLKKAKEELQ
ncbi:sodium:proton antiporter [Chloroflexota bacterium]